MRMRFRRPRVTHAHAHARAAGILVETDMRTDQELQPLAVAKVLKQLVDKETPELVILGKQSIDDDANQTGQLLAGLLDWAQATFASKVELDAAAKVRATRARSRPHHANCRHRPCVWCARSMAACRPCSCPCPP